MNQEAGATIVPMIIFGVFMLIYLVVLLFVIVGMWKAYSKAGHPGIACIVPIWNFIVIIQMAGKPIWWIFLMFIPFVNLIVAILLNIAVAKSFGRSEMFGIGLVFLPFIFWPILGFGDSRFQGVKA